MQKHPEAPIRKRSDACPKKETSQQKKESRHFSAVICWVTTPKFFLQMMERAMRPSVNDALSNLSPRSSRLFF